MDNVAESGEESEDEWNYYRVEPTEDKEAAAPQESDVSNFSLMVLSCLYVVWTFKIGPLHSFLS